VRERKTDSGRERRKDRGGEREGERRREKEREEKGREGERRGEKGGEGEIHSRSFVFMSPLRKHFSKAKTLLKG
jgi:hypothetical protein